MGHLQLVEGAAFHKFFRKSGQYAAIFYHLVGATPARLWLRRKGDIKKPGGSLNGNGNSLSAPRSDG